MKITKQRLQRIIQEELQGILLEQDAAFNALPALQQAFEASRFGTGAGGMDAFDDAGKPKGTASNAQLAELAPRVTDQEQLNKMIGFIKKFGGDKVVAHFKNKAKPAASPAGDAPGGTVDPKVAALQKKAAAGDITSKQILRQYKKQQARKAGGV
jgi:hypothetical protein